MPKTILLIDDSATMLMSLRQTLELAQFKVETAPDGLDAMQRIKSGFKPDLVITDINMPRMNGIDFIRHARAVLRFTPILALTTESEAKKRDEAKQLGATGWLVKPVPGMELLKVVKHLLPGT